jgi:hypothetical protein
MIALGAKVINNSGLTIPATCEIILADMQDKGAKLQLPAAAN